MQTVLIPLKENRSIVVYSEDDIDPYLDNNKRLRGEEQKSDWGRHVASIPNIILVQWLNEAWKSGHEVRYLSAEWDEIVAKKLQDPEWAYLRVDGVSHRVGWGK
jgi:hypothetical protein